MQTDQEWKLEDLIFLAASIRSILGLTYTGKELFGIISVTHRIIQKAGGSAIDAKPELRSGRQWKTQQNGDKDLTWWLLSQMPLPLVTHTLCWILDASMLSKHFPNFPCLCAAFSSNSDCWVVSAGVWLLSCDHTPTSRGRGRKALAFSASMVKTRGGPPTDFLIVELPKAKQGW